jgi:hypothetical protein
MAKELNTRPVQTWLIGRIEKTLKGPNAATRDAIRAALEPLAIALPAFRTRFAGSIAGVPRHFPFGFQLALPLCAFSLNALGLQRGLKFRPLRSFGLTGFCFGLFSLAGILDCLAVGRTRRSLRQPIRESGVRGLGAKLFQGRLLSNGGSLLPLEKIRFLKAAHLF